MRNHILFPLVSAGMILTVSGCDTLTGGPYSIFNDRAQTVGASSVIDSEAFEPIYLPVLLDPTLQEREEDSREVGIAIDKAFAEFTRKYSKEEPEEYELQRNAVQDRILAASVLRCDFYKRYLKRIDQTTNLALGSLATIAGAAGAIVTGTTAARALAGTAGIFSGVRAEFNEDLFASLAIHAITAGINAKRAVIKSEIKEKRKEAQENGNPRSYSVQDAVGDALRYHGACNLVDGLEAAGAAAERIVDPGLKALERQAEQFKKTKDALEKALQPTE